MCRWTEYGWTGCFLGLEAFQRVWRLAMSGLHLQYQEPIAIPIFFPKYLFPRFSCEKSLNSVCKTKQIRVAKYMSLVLNNVAKWEGFVLNRVGVCGHRRHTSNQTSLECPAPGAHYGFIVFSFWMPREVFPASFGGGVPPCSSNPDPISHTRFQTRPFKSTPVFRPGKGRIRN